VCLTGDVLEQRTADDGDGDALGLLVVDGKAGFGSMAVDQLDAEDLRLWEAGRDGDLEVRRLGLLVDNLFDIFDLRVP